MREFDILQGDAREVLPWIETGSIHVVCTSPPYWGLRSYKCDPVVWGGLENCAHTWNDHRWYTEQSAGAGSGEAFSEAGPANAKRLKEARWRQDSICTRCGAWLGSLGLEPDPGMYVNHLVEIFREVRRVLRDDGVLFIVIGDSYARSAAKGQHRPGDSGKQAYIYDHGGGRASSCANLESESCGSSDGFAGRGDRALVRVGGGGLKAKDLVGIPWMLAFALRADGWYLRSSIVWQKANPLPESVRDRCTSSYENVFMLSKSGRYLFDSLAIAEPLDRPAEHLRKTPGKFGGANKWLEASKQNRTQSGREYVGTPTGTRNCRDVWTISTQSSKLKFYAAFPEKLAERCILAGSSERGCCPKCGAGWVRVLAPKPKMADPKQHEYRGVWSTQDPQAASRRMLLNVKQARDAGEDHDNPFRGTATLGFRPACPHYDDRYCTEFPKSRSARKRSQRDASGDWWKRVRRRPGKDDWPVVPAVVLDCFAGSGTTLLVAQRLGRRSIGIELSESYCQMSRERIAQEMAKPIPAMGPGHVRKAKAKIESADGSQMELFDSQQTKR